MRLLSLLPVVAVFAASGAYAQSLKLADIFQDHMVLPREGAVIEGVSGPNENLTATFNTVTAMATSDAQGRFSLRLPAIPAGQAGTLVVSSPSGQQQITDVIAGDVFLCSGQSNMQVPVTRSLNYDTVIGNSANDAIRNAHIQVRTGLAAQDHFSAPVDWKKASPQTTADFSATCYYFAKSLYERTGVPVGMVHSSLGGSNITTWLDDASLAKFPKYSEDAALLKIAATDPDASGKAMGRRFEGWWQASGGKGKPWAATPAELRTWAKVPDMKLNWERWGVAELAAYDGDLWYATHITLTKAQAAQGAELVLGQVDDIDYSWVNGKALGYTAGGVHKYSLPAGSLKAGDNTIVVNVIDLWNTGGIFGDTAPQLKIGSESLTLADWGYQTVPVAQKYPPRAPWDATGGVSILHNAMIAPLGHFAFKGAVWYQGESNVGDANYQALLTTLMQQWRGAFGAELPVAVVQLADFGERPTRPVDSAWARLREAQRLAVLADPHATLATAIDLGEATDIHPANKNDLGKRLARAMAVKAYGVTGISESGPQITTLHWDGTNDDLILSFTGQEGDFITYSSSHPIGFEICGHDGCRYAEADIRGRQVILRDVAAAEKVRYCWADAPTCTLYDGANGLPAIPFEQGIDN